MGVRASNARFRTFGTKLVVRAVVAFSFPRAAPITRILSSISSTSNAVGHHTLPASTGLLPSAASPASIMESVKESTLNAKETNGLCDSGCSAHRSGDRWFCADL